VTIERIWSLVAPWDFKRPSKTSPRFKTTSRSSISEAPGRSSVLATSLTFSGTTRTSIELNGASMTLV
jgi:hypothetical protein